MKVKIFLSLLISSVLLYSCGDETLPKPKGMLRLEYPEASYTSIKDTCPYFFSKNKEAEISVSDNCAITVNYPKMNASIFITYKPVSDDLNKLLRDAQKLTYEHVAKADNIQEQPFINVDNKVYGMFYLVTGNAASASQFYVTDSTSHFLTGSLYFNTKPNYDSVLPAAQYIEKDIRKIMETIRWK
ncbi:gliding motility lipoprotein GldD [Joostella atrarenae]|uniref:Gliding motility lipoprotein GldD n=1 Tax=Joostella atrarenae TaxID=679257 RepID=A0ABS9IYJ4_9FLAO|nr:gliding motility lipoprotein GldD [Joostella atrarenae]MCF8713254.1 gliding motility lipoprotein GldD [Joostella atrarenae]